MSQNVLVIGSGGREHAICWKLSQSTHVNKIFVSPGSIAISQVNKVSNVALDIKNFPVSNNIQFFIIVSFIKYQYVNLCL